MEGNTCAQIIINGAYTQATPLVSKRYASQALREMDEDVGAPKNLVANLAGELSGKHTNWMNEIRKQGINCLRWIEKGRHNQNAQAEREIGELKHRWKKTMAEKGVPKRLWDRGLVHEAELLFRISRGAGS